MVVSDLTKALVSKNLLTKKKSKSDKRSYQLQLTEKGKKVCNESVKIIEQLDHDLFAKSGNSPMLLDMLRSILK